IPSRFIAPSARDRWGDIGAPGAPLDRALGVAVHVARWRKRTGIEPARTASPHSSSDLKSEPGTSAGNASGGDSTAARLQGLGPCDDPTVARPADIVIDDLAAPRLPDAVWAMNAVSVEEARQRVPLDEAGLLADARRQTGLADFGDDDFREGL